MPISYTALTMHGWDRNKRSRGKKGLIVDFLCNFV